VHSHPRPGAGPRRRLLLATTNPAKQRELSRLLADLPIELVGPNALGTPPRVEETGATFEENARIKAHAYADWSGLAALADDGGLEIDALGGEPGVRSARWLGREASDEELIAATLRRMHGLPPERRGAALRLVVALVLPDGREVLGEGVIRGVIAEQATNGRERGFPFRSVFYLPSLGKYYLDLTGEEHERINHRRAALVPVRAALERYAAVPGT
jgi:XTP/dITP diphosphohydrolase